MGFVDQLLLLIERYCAGAGIAEATLSYRLFNDGKRVAILRRGGDVGTKNYARAVLWLSANWPEGADWPDSIQRPEFQGNGEAA